MNHWNNFPACTFMTDFEIVVVQNEHARLERERLEQPQDHDQDLHDNNHQNQHQNDDDNNDNAIFYQDLDLNLYLSR